MSINYRKRISLGSGIKLNLSKKGVSTTIGVPGASVNVGKNGVYLNSNIPGSGLYSRKRITTGGEKTTSNITMGDKSIYEIIMMIMLGNFTVTAIWCVLFPHYEDTIFVLIICVISLIIFWAMWFGLGDEI